MKQYKGTTEPTKHVLVYPEYDPETACGPGIVWESEQAITPAIAEEYNRELRLSGVSTRWIPSSGLERA